MVPDTATINLQGCQVNYQKALVIKCPLKLSCKNSPSPVCLSLDKYLKAQYETEEAKQPIPTPEASFLTAETEGKEQGKREAGRREMKANLVIYARRSKLHRRQRSMH